MILSAGRGRGRPAAHPERAAAAERPLRQRLRHHPERLPGHAPHHEAAGVGPVLLLVRALRHVDLHHTGGDQPSLRHHRHDLGALQRGRQLGGGRLRRLQRRRGRRGLRHPDPGPADQSQDRARDLPGLRRARAAVDPRAQGPPVPAGLHGGRRDRLGQHPRHALRDPDRVAAAVEDGLLHGRLQFLHRDPPDRRGRPPRLPRRPLLRRGGDLRPRDRRRVAAPRRGCSRCGWRTRTNRRPGHGTPGSPPRSDRPRRPAWSDRPLGARPSPPCARGPDRAEVRPATADGRTPPDPAAFWNSATVYFLLTDRFQNGDSTNDRALGPRAGRSGAAQLRGWRPRRRAPEDRGGLLRQPGRERHLDDALRGADPRGAWTREPERPTASTATGPATGPPWTRRWEPRTTFARWWTRPTGTASACSWMRSSTTPGR